MALCHTNLWSFSRRLSFQDQPVRERKAIMEFVTSDISYTKAMQFLRFGTHVARALNLDLLFNLLPIYCSSHLWIWLLSGHFFCRTKTTHSRKTSPQVHQKIDSSSRKTTENSISSRKNGLLLSSAKNSDVNANKSSELKKFSLFIFQHISLRYLINV